MGFLSTLGICGKLKVSDRLSWWEGRVCDEVIWKFVSGQESVEKLRKGRMGGRSWSI